MLKIPFSEITPEALFLTRRDFLKSAGIVSAGAALLAACAMPPAGDTVDNSAGDPPATDAIADEFGDPLNTYEEITNYNNYYEFTTDKEGVAPLSRNFQTSPWSVAVGGLVANPRTYDIDELKTLFDQEERVYRLRCVEGWSMVIPWLGFPLAKLLALAEPKSEAKFVRFTALLDKSQFPGQKVSWYDWPYVEGLRMDEAMNDLTILATGMYGRDLVPPNGAPFRLVVPWKYGFKSIKAIVKIDLVTEMPVSLWMRAAPSEYGFYSNVNPDVPHPRWSQSSERRIGELQRRPSLKFNGYEAEVGQLYAGMDLQVNY